LRGDKKDKRGKKDKKCPMEDRKGERMDKVTGCNYADWECLEDWAEENGMAEPCEEFAGDEVKRELCWKAIAEHNPPCDKDDGECWFTFMTEVAGIRKIKGAWEVTKCEYGDFDCLLFAAMANPPDCKEDDVPCYVYWMVKYPACKADDDKCWAAFDDYMSALDDLKCPGEMKKVEKARKECHKKGKKERGEPLWELTGCKY